MSNKEYLYVGHYYDKDGNYILKIGTTNNLKRRCQEHNRKYRGASNFPMRAGDSFTYDWTLPLSKYNTLRYEDSNKAKWQKELFGFFQSNDRFVFLEKPACAVVKIKKEYVIAL